MKYFIRVYEKNSTLEVEKWVKKKPQVLDLLVCGTNTNK
jgi:hypothetical protein